MELFARATLTDDEKALLDRDGHVLLPELLVDGACARLTRSLSHILSLAAEKGIAPNHYSAEHDDYLASLVGHPEMLALARSALGPQIRFDHCVALNRPGGNPGAGWHSHDYAEDRPDLGFLRIFFYVNGFASDDGALLVAPGSHLWRDPHITSVDWIEGKIHPITGQPLTVEALEAPPGTVALMWTHAAHAVSPRKPGSDTRWTVVYAYRNPGAPCSPARWITPAFEKNPPPGADGLMGEQ